MSKIQKAQQNSLYKARCCTTLLQKPNIILTTIYKSPNTILATIDKSPNIILATIYKKPNNILASIYKSPILFWQKQLHYAKAQKYSLAKTYFHLLKSLTHGKLNFL